ncbi:MAG TPA: hypothetical protein VEO73_05815, partial [Gemmatimonadales bacterium]|nr:hypothetical protein [Gemmatimonadales bacterium]
MIWAIRMIPVVRMVWVIGLIPAAPSTLPPSAVPIAAGRLIGSVASWQVARRKNDSPTGVVIH